MLLEEVKVKKTIVLENNNCNVYLGVSVNVILSFICGKYINYLLAALPRSLTLARLIVLFKNRV